MNFKLGLMLLSAQLFLFSCAPKDEKLNRPDTGVIRTNNFPTSEEAIKMLFISLDRSVEALHYLKASLDANYAKDKQITVEDTGVNTKKITLAAASFENEIYVQSGQVGVVSNIELNEDKTIKSVVIVQDDTVGNAKQDLFLKTKLDRSILTATNIVKEIKISKSTKENEVNIYTAKVKVWDQLDSVSNGNGASNTSIEFSFVWDGKAESLANDIQIVSADLGHNKVKETRFNAKSLKSTLVVNLAADCAKLNGAIDLTSTASPKKGQSSNEVYNVTIEDSSIFVKGKSASFKAAACASRPVVDLRKLL